MSTPPAASKLYQCRVVCVSVFFTSSSVAGAATVVAENGWPKDLTELPGVGTYTAAAIRNFAFGEDVLPLDTNVLRVQERTGHSFGAPAAQALMDLGATVCLARVPRCGVCPLSGRCPSRVWRTRIPRLRHQAISSRTVGTIAARRLTSLPSASPKPPGSMKSRCMSMTSSAVVLGSKR